MLGYCVTVKETSRELSNKERIKIKDTTNAHKLDEVVENDGTPFVITPVAYAILNIHNEKATPPDYDQYLVVDESGAKYITGSNSFWESFKSIWDEMQGDTESWSIEVYKIDSKNYKGKSFITCSIT